MFGGICCALVLINLCAVSLFINFLPSGVENYRGNHCSQVGIEFFRASILLIRRTNNIPCNIPSFEGTWSRLMFCFAKCKLHHVNYIFKFHGVHNLKTEAESFNLHPRYVSKGISNNRYH